MNLIVWDIVGGVNEKNSIVNTVRSDNWSTESVIKATNVISVPIAKFCMKKKDNDLIHKYLSTRWIL